MMMKKLMPVLVLLVFAVGGAAQKSSSSSSLAGDLQAMVETERAFAQTATEKGIRDSFLAFIADEGILFRPTAVNGKQFLEKQKPRPGYLTWQPAYADISGAGDMGMTTGPWQFREKGPEDKPVAFGNFMTVWRKQADGSWKFAIDFGISYEQANEVAAWELPANFNRARTGAKGDLTKEQASLLALEEKFSKASQADGFAKAFINYAADDVRILREGMLPVAGFKEASAALALKTGTRPLTWQPIKAEVASSGDFGFTYGGYQLKGQSGSDAMEQGNYVRVWKKLGGKWRVIMDVMVELPKPAAS
ncbi:MAG: nuclear transport factor 2 family protein, partial [Acidobacteria bacterium]|nr:nuclear transport factor 2 family protein [Acidobacteriota bacterium]